MSRIGDMYPEQIDRHQHREIVQQPPMGPVPQGAPNGFDRVVVPANGVRPASPLTDDTMKILAEIVDQLKRAAIFTRQPNHLAPPRSATPFDIYTNLTVTLPLAATTVVLSYEVPKGAILVINRFANELETPAAYTQVSWNFTFKGAPIRIPARWLSGATENTAYVNFQRRLGDVQNPTRMEAPLIFRDGGTLLLTATNIDVIAHIAEARLMGWQWVPDFSSSTTDLSPEFML